MVKKKVKKKVSKKKRKETGEKIGKVIKEHAEKIKRSYVGEKIYQMKRKHKILFSVIIIFVLILVLVFGARIYLLFNFLLGNDTLVKLTADNQDFFLKNSESANVEFEIYVSTNLFCQARCEYIFQDLSSGYILDKSNFSTKLSNPNSFSYNLVAPESGEGQVLYHFKVSCRSENKGLCNTDEEEKRRSYLIALNYELSDEQKLFRNESTEELQRAIFDVDELNRINLENKELNKILGETITIEDLPKNNITLIEEELDLKLEELKNYEYQNVLSDGLAEKINFTRMELVSLNNDLIGDIENYNSLVFNLIRVKAGLTDLVSDKNISEEDYELIYKLVIRYNNLVERLQDKFDLELESYYVESLSGDIQEVKLNLTPSPIGNYTYRELSSFSLGAIEKPFRSNYSSGRFIGVEEPMCCYKGDCDICCSEDCSSEKDKYPIILLHGHSFNDAISAESSLGDLEDIKEELSKDGVIDGGYVILKKLEAMGTFARTNRQIVFAASYYFDIFQNRDETIILQSKAESLDTYAVRLNDIIENVKLITNRDKVYIVAHSMGGLVSRRYIQIFGDEDVEKLVMIGTPNHGVDGIILSGCPVFGADIHCKAMDKDSLFLNKLNYGEEPEINVSMIIGSGCSMNGEDSDGIVKNSSAYLEWANNYYVNGNCSGVNTLHIEMLKTDLYPDTYDIVKRELGIGED